ncbi:MAG: hypothetical protein E6F99_21140 [Actinobacteria bacterium]|nr:MAG: hypothetical protein E6F99_21140 [Actinomycetota bacterium]
MSEATLQALRDAGAKIDALEPGQREVFASLTPEELAVVTSIQVRLNAAESEVTGQMADTNNNLC